MYVQKRSGSHECVMQRERLGRLLREGLEDFDDDGEDVFDEVIEGGCVVIERLKGIIHAVLYRSFWVNVMLLTLY